MALTADKNTKTRGLPDGELRVAIATGETLYVGGHAGRVKATGRVKAAAALATEDYEGLVTAIEADSGTPTGVGVAAGTQFAVIQFGQEALATIKTAIRTSTSVGRTLFVGDDDSAGGTAVGTATARRPMGELVAFEASDKSTGWVALRRPSVNGNIAV